MAKAHIRLLRIPSKVKGFPLWKAQKISGTENAGAMKNLSRLLGELKEELRMKGKFRQGDGTWRHAKGDRADERVVVLDADVSTCTMSWLPGEAYPERFFNGRNRRSEHGWYGKPAWRGLKPLREPPSRCS